MEFPIIACGRRDPWNKGKLVGQKAPLKLKEIWAIRVRLQLAEQRRELALFNLAIDSKLRACDLVKLRVRDVCTEDLDQEVDGSGWLWHLWTVAYPEATAPLTAL